MKLFTIKAVNLVIGLLFFGLILTGCFNKDDYMVKLIGAAKDKSVEHAIGVSVSRFPLNFSDETNGYLPGGVFDGYYNIEFDWSALGFDQKTSSIRVIMNYREKGLPAAFYFSENKPGLRCGIIYILDESGFGHEYDSGMVFREGRIAVYAFKKD